MKLVIDYETRSTCDLSKCGAAVYAEDETTEILCCAVKVDNEKPRIWFPKWVWGILERIDLPELRARLEALNPLTDEELFQLLEEAEEIEAHNVGFERAIWSYCARKKYDWPEVPVPKLRCSLAKCSYHALPRALEQACAALKLVVQKDMEGAALMKKMCKPRKPTKKDREELLASGEVLELENGEFYHPESDCRFFLWHQEPEQIIRLAEYCCQDTEAEYAVSQALPDLPPSELANWQLDQEINFRGINADVATAKRFITEIGILEARLLDETATLTDGAVQSPKQVAASLRWLAEQGVNLPDLTKNTVATALKNPDCAPAVRHLLSIRQQLGRASTAKYQAIVNASNQDGRIRGSILYHGAATGRFAGKLIQPHNMPRGQFKDTDACIGHVQDCGFDELFQTLYGDTMGAASTCLRGMLTASEGNELVTADFSAIEGRVIAWLAGEEAVLDGYRQKLDPYRVDASMVYNVPYASIKKTDPKRQTGKACNLGLGFGGGIGAFHTMATIYRVNLEELPEHVRPLATEEIIERAEKNATNYLKKNAGKMSREAAIACDIVKQLWRIKRPNIVKFWYGLEEAAVLAVKNPGRVYRCNSVFYKSDEQFLRCKLPSGRYLHYYNPALQEKETPWGEMKEVITFFGVDSVTRKFSKSHLYSGLLAENCTQAVARDLLCSALLRVEAAGYPVVLHVHDEIVSDVPKGSCDLKHFEALMSEAPSWAKGLPIAAEGWVGKRYRK